MFEKKCEHIIGYCAGKLITVVDCEEVRGFIAEVQHFNTSRKAVSHPGHLVFVNYCGCCGEVVDKEGNERALQKLAKSMGGWLGDEASES